MTHRPDVVFIMADQLRHDWLSCAGASWCPTPNIDRLAAMGTRYTQCITNSPVCLPARIGLATGVRPHRLGATDNVGHIPDWAPCYHRYFGEHGFEVVLRGKAHLDAVESMAEDIPRDRARPYLERVGFTDAIEYEGKVVSAWRWNPAAPTPGGSTRRDCWSAIGRATPPGSRASGWTRRPCPHPCPTRPTSTGPSPTTRWPGSSGPPSIAPHTSSSASVAHTRPTIPRRPGPDISLGPRCRRRSPCPMACAIPWHEPGVVPFRFTPEQVLALRWNYSALVAHIDAQVGRTLEAVEVRGRLEDTIFVLLIIAGGGLAARTTSDALCEFNDAQATACELAGLPPLPGSEAISMAGRPAGRDFQVSTYKDFNLIRDRRHKYVEVVRGGRYLYDRDGDPTECRNLTTEQPELAARLRRDLRTTLS